MDKKEVYMEGDNNFAEFLHSRRKEKGMTQSELADKLGISNKAVSKWETGESMPDTSLLVPLSGILGVTIDELLKGYTAGGQETVSAREEEPVRGNAALRVAATVTYCVIAVCGLTAFLIVGFTVGWNPYWVIIADAVMSGGIIGTAFPLFDKVRNAKKVSAGENPYSEGISGIIMTACTIAFITAGAVSGLWHPLWIIMVSGGVVSATIAAVGELYAHKNAAGKDK